MTRIISIMEHPLIGHNVLLVQIGAHANTRPNVFPTISSGIRHRNRQPPSPHEHVRTGDPSRCSHRSGNDPIPHSLWRVQNVIVFEDDLQLPEGTEVEIVLSKPEPVQNRLCPRPTSNCRHLLALLQDYPQTRPGSSIATCMALLQHDSWNPTSTAGHTLKNHSVMATMYLRFTSQRSSILMGTRAIQVNKTIITQ
jgi:hypothetical protein